MLTTLLLAGSLILAPASRRPLPPGPPVGLPLTIPIVWLDYVVLERFEYDPRNKNGIYTRVDDTIGTERRLRWRWVVTRDPANGRVVRYHFYYFLPER